MAFTLDNFKGSSKPAAEVTANKYSDILQDAQRPLQQTQSQYKSFLDGFGELTGFISSFDMDDDANGSLAQLDGSLQGLDSNWRQFESSVKAALKNLPKNSVEADNVRHTVASSAEASEAKIDAQIKILQGKLKDVKASGSESQKDYKGSLDAWEESLKKAPDGATAADRALFDTYIKNQKSFQDYEIAKEKYETYKTDKEEYDQAYADWQAEGSEGTAPIAPAAVEDPETSNDPATGAPYIKTKQKSPTYGEPPEVDPDKSVKKRTYSSADEAMRKGGPDGLRLFLKELVEAHALAVKGAAPMSEAEKVKKEAIQKFYDTAAKKRLALEDPKALDDQHVSDLTKRIEVLKNLKASIAETADQYAEEAMKYKPKTNVTKNAEAKNRENNRTNDANQQDYQRNQWGFNGSSGFGGGFDLNAYNPNAWRPQQTAI